MIFKKTTLCLIGIISTIAIKAQEKKSFSLISAQNFAVENSFQVKNAKTDIEIARKKIMETTAIGLPQLNAEGNFQDFINIPTQVIPAKAFNPAADPSVLAPVRFGTNYNSSASIVASQLIFSGQYLVGLQASKTYASLSMQNLSKTESEIRRAVAQSYFTVLMALENKEVLKKTLENSEKIWQETQQLYKNGLVEESAVDQLELLVSNLKNAKSKIEKQTELAYMLLKFQMGMNIEDPIELTETLVGILGQIQAENLVSNEFKAQSHIDFQLLETQKRLMTLNLKKERVAYMPRIATFLSHSKNAFRNDLSFGAGTPWYPATIWGLKVSLPIFDGGGQFARTKSAKLELEKTINNQSMLEQSLKLQVQSAKSSLSNAIEVLKTEKQNLALAEKIQDKTLKKYKEGISSSFELTQIQNQYLTTQSNYINAMFELLNANQKLEKALGINVTK
jgi:outer membrane protein